MYIYIGYVADRNNKGKAEGKRFTQTVAKWLNRSAFGWGTLYLASRALGAQCWRWYARMSGGGLWNDYGACELEYHDTLLLACQQHRMIAYFSSKNNTHKVVPHILSTHTSPCPTSFRPLPFGLKHSKYKNHKKFWRNQDKHIALSTE